MQGGVISLQYEQSGYNGSFRKEEGMTDLGIIEFSPVAQFAIGSNHRIMRWNRACELMTGMAAEEMIGTDRHWEPFYRTKRPLLADLVVDHDRKGMLRVRRISRSGMS